MKPFVSWFRGLVHKPFRLPARTTCLCAVAVITHRGVALADWVPSGPRGDMGSPAGEQCNGRISSIQVWTGGNYYLYVGASSGGIWRTDPTAFNLVWEDLGRNLPNPSVTALAVQPNNPSEIFVGTGEWQRYAGGGMFYTTNGGATWSQVNVGVPASFFRMAYLPGNTNIIMAASSSGLLRSQTGPNGPWQVALRGCVTDFTIHPSNPNVLFAAVGNLGLGLGASGPQGDGIYKSTDAGSNWALISAASIPTNQVYRACVTACRNSPNIMVAVWAGSTNGGTNIRGVLKSTDGGTNWSDISGPLAGAGAGQTFHVLSVAIAPTDANQIYVGSSDLWRSFDGGANWATVNGVVTTPTEISHHADFTQIYVNPVSNFQLFFCNDGGVYSYFLGDSQSASLNGDNLTGLQVAQIYDIDARGNIRFIAMQDDEISGSIDTGATWKLFHPASRNFLIDGFRVAISDASPQNPTYWCISGSGGTRNCLRRGTFTTSVVDITCPNTNFGNIYYDRFTDKIFYTTSEPKIISYPANIGNPTIEAQLSPGLGAVTGSYLDGQTMYAWGGGAPLTYNVAVLRLNGQSWTVARNVLVGVPGETNAVMQIVASRRLSAEAWAVLTGLATDAKVFHSMDYGATWTDISGDLTGRIVGAVNTIVASPFDSNELYVGTQSGGVFRSTDGGRHWEPFQSGLPIVAVTDMIYLVDQSHRDTDKLLIATFGRGTYERALDRPGPVYVDQRNITMPWLGTIEDPDVSLTQGLSDTPLRGYLLLNGSVPYSGSRTLNKPMTIGAYEFATRLGQ